MTSKLNTFKEILIKFLKGQALKLALKKILGSATAGGFKGWLVKLILTELYEELGEPIIKAGVNHVGYLYDKHKGKVTIKKIEKARNENDEDAYRTNVNDVFDK